MNHWPQKMLMGAATLAALLSVNGVAQAEYPPHWSFYRPVPTVGVAPVQPVMAPAATYAAPAAYAAPVGGYPQGACCPPPVYCQRPIAPQYPPVYAQTTTYYRPTVVGYTPTVTGYAPATTYGPRRYGFFRPPAYVTPVQATTYYAPGYGY